MELVEEHGKGRGVCVGFLERASMMRSKALRQVVL